jgi:hypothetical protein
MNAAEALSSLRSFLQEVGEDVIVRRYSGTGPTRTVTERTTRARVKGYQPNELVGAIVQGDRKVIMLVDALADLLPLSTADKLVIRGREVAIKGVDDSTRRIGGTLIGLDLQVAG